MDEDTVTTTTSELSPAPAPSAPDLAPEAPIDPGMTVVSVDELVDRLIQSADTGEEDGEPVDLLPVELDEGMGDGDVGVSDVVPGLVSDAIDILLDIRKGMENVESIERTVNHPLLTTPFQDYTVTEGLLLLVLLCFFIKACMNMVRRAFSWLL